MKSIQRSMRYVAGAAIVWSGLLSAAVRGQAPNAEVRRYQALNIFQNRCLHCHGEAAKAKLRILDRTLLVRERKVIDPGHPENSELFDLVEGGSMPPGDHPKVPQGEIEILRQWIRDGAEALPSTTDESYVLWSIVSDLRDEKIKKNLSIRYLSLNHLLTQQSASQNIAQQREKLQQVLDTFHTADKPTPSLRAIEPTNTIFRIDLKELGWDRPPYPKAEERWSRLNMYDLLLLEYPYGRLPTGSPFYREGVLEYLLGLQGAGQVRPITYVAADWLASVLTQPGHPLCRDFLHLLGKSANKPLPNGVKRPNSAPSGAIELAANWTKGGNVSENGLERGESIVDPQTRRLPDGQKKNWRTLSEKNLLADLLKQDPQGSIPIVPLDGITYRNHPSSDPQLTAEFVAADFKDLDIAKKENRKPLSKTVFQPGEKLGLWFQASEPARYVLYFARHKEASPRWNSIDARKGKRLGPGGIPMKLEEGGQEANEEIILLACFESGIDNNELAAGVVLKGDGIRDRFIHPFYELKSNGRVIPPDPSKMVKLTLLVTTRPSKDR